MICQGRLTEESATPLSHFPLLLVYKCGFILYIYGLGEKRKLRLKKRLQDISFKENFCIPNKRSTPSRFTVYHI